jgi:hypothetical protein
LYQLENTFRNHETENTTDHHSHSLGRTCFSFLCLKLRERSKAKGFTTNEETNLMLMTIAIILIVLWALGLITSFSLGGFIHILLVAAIIMILIRLIQGRHIV